MIKHRKDARNRLKESTLAEYNSLIQAANLTPTQAGILDKYINKDKSISDIASELFCSDSTIRKHLAKAYEKIAKL